MKRVRDLKIGDTIYLVKEKDVEECVVTKIIQRDRIITLQYKYKTEYYSLRCRSERSIYRISALRVVIIDSELLYFKKWIK